MQISRHIYCLCNLPLNKRLVVTAAQLHLSPCSTVTSLIQYSCSKAWLHEGYICCHVEMAKGFGSGINAMFCELSSYMFLWYIGEEE